MFDCSGPRIGFISPLQTAEDVALHLYDHLSARHVLTHGKAHASHRYVTLWVQRGFQAGKFCGVCGAVLGAGEAENEKRSGAALAFGV